MGTEPLLYFCCLFYQYSHPIIISNNIWDNRRECGSYMYRLFPIYSKLYALGSIHLIFYQQPINHHSFNTCFVSASFLYRIGSILDEISKHLTYINRHFIIFLISFKFFNLILKYHVSWYFLPIHTDSNLPDHYSNNNYNRLP